MEIAVWIGPVPFKGILRDFILLASKTGSLKTSMANSLSTVCFIGSSLRRFLRIFAWLDLPLGKVNNFVIFSISQSGSRSILRSSPFFNGADSE